MEQKNYYYIDSFFVTLDEFTRNSSISGYKYLSRKNSAERALWYIIHISTIICIYLMISVTWDQYMTNPTVTTLDTHAYPINKIPLPGISICNINKISRSKAEAYAANLSNKSGVNYTDVLNLIKLYGRLYDYNLAPNEEELVLQIQNLLEKYDSKNGYFNTQKTLYALAITCPEFISDCYWKGQKYDCGDLFVEELTMEGHCCIFNYYSERSTKQVSKVVQDNNLEPLKLDYSSVYEGLRVTLAFNQSDYFYNTLSMLGSKVLVSLPYDYPDTTSGGLTETLIPNGSEVSLKINSITTFTTEEVKRYSIEKRGCIFREEETTLFGGYSYSDCIMDCKIKSILALCNCIPFNYIHVFPERDYDQCTLADLKCLNTYADKWIRLYPLNTDSSELMREKQDSLNCNSCMPACSDTIYTVSNDRSSIFSPNREDLNYSIVHVSFEGPYGTLNKQDVLLYWYDIVGFFGGLCGVISGISIASLVEVFYFFTYRFYLNIVKQSNKISY